MGFPQESAYCATKFGIEGLAKALAEECGDSRNPCQHDHPGGAAHQAHRAFPRRRSGPSRRRTDLGIFRGARRRVRGLRPPPRRRGRGAERAPRSKPTGWRTWSGTGAFRLPARRGRNLAACEQSGAAQNSRWGLDQRCIPPEPLHFVPLIVAFRTKYTRYSSLTRRPHRENWVSRASTGRTGPTVENWASPISALTPLYPQATSE